MYEEKPQQGLLQSRYLGRIIWAVFGLLLLAALIIPGSSRSGDAPRPGGPPALDAFSSRVIEAELSLKDGQSLTAEEARELEPYLKVRALTKAGPMTPEEMDDIAGLLRDYQAELEALPDPVSRQTLRNHRNRLLFDAHRRLDKEVGQIALQELREALYN